MEQLTDEWFTAQLGKGIADIVARTKSGWGASRADYKSKLVIERLTGTITDGIRTSAMQWGMDMEPEAREAYSERELVAVEQVGFIDHPVIAMSGASPDGLVGEEGMVEVKCPNTKTHIVTLRGRKVTKKYITQMQWQMACTGRRFFVDRVSSHGRLWL